MEEKICPRCGGDPKPITEFNWKVKGKRRQTHCKTCQSELTREHYRKNPEPYLARARRSRKRAKEWLKEYLTRSKCVDCGNNDARVLEFDHVNGDKVNAVTTMANSGYSIATLEKEAAKCEIRCANCHRIRHFDESDWRA